MFPLEFLMANVLSFLTQDLYGAFGTCFLFFTPYLFRFARLNLELSNYCLVEFSGHLQTTSSPEHSSDLLPVLDGMSNLQIEVKTKFLM